MSLEQVGIHADDEALEAFGLAMAMVAMGLQDALQEEPYNSALVPLATDLISAYMLKSFGTTDIIANLMADSLVASLLKEMDL